MRPSNGALSLIGLATAGTGLALMMSNPLPSSPPERPKMILDALRDGTPIYYFAIGSNLSRTHLEGRSVCGEKIRVVSMEPAIVPDHRLAFNCMAFPPIEPGVGSLEPLVEDGEHAPLLEYERRECHGALIKLSPEDYERVYLSEGGGQGRLQGYEEIVVTAVPYDGNREPVRAVAFRAREFVRLRKDPAPNPCYIRILRNGAEELGLRPSYRKWLENHPVQRMSPVLKFLARNSFFYTIVSLFFLKLRLPNRVQSWYLYRTYVPPTETSMVRRVVGETLTGLILLPSASIGLLLRGFMELTGTMSPRMRDSLSNRFGV